MMNLSDFDFDLPKGLIAQTPARPRNQARLLVYQRQNGKIIDDYFYNLEKHLPFKSTLVLNDSRVEKSRLRFGSTEVFVLETVNPNTLRALVKPGRKFKAGSKLSIPLDEAELVIETLDVDNEGTRTLRFSLSLDDGRLSRYRLTPFPPYIRQNERLSGQYQTVYAKPLGSKAAPTAGLHFTSEQLKEISQNHPIAKVTLHVGLGTFSPVREKDIKNHKLHSENYSISSHTANLLNTARNITAVGTTSLRVLEAAGPKFKKITGETDIFITPGYKFKSTDALVTNFHLPKSSLMMLVAAFVGSIEEVQRIYQHAISNKYRFYSFGDAMLIL